MRDFDASWPSHDGRKHMKRTRDLTEKTDDGFKVLEYGILNKRYVLEKAPAASVDTTLILTNNNTADWQIPL
jgi:hypothetical protein